ncbi:DUF6382 domain-containing protein [Salipaludibacillus daqingensis]|uniref:DUF6382 domain-containing protein n=1 Tax=Salipaludibacillus daqingensis TaxID=3041001 RepID=UPI002474E036|nr:DUF6382 domain-containing protein [Salipaludibacillus daqingensis]
MSLRVYDLTYDFHQKNGHYLLFHEKQEKQVTEEDIVPLQLKMMQSNQIPNLLPLSIEEIDFNVRLFYNVTSKKDLATFLQKDSLSSHEFYQLFINIVTTLEQSKLYMLNEHHYILKEEFIFVGKGTEDLYLTFLPFKHVDKEKDSLAELKDLLTSVLKKVENMQSSEKKGITNYIDNSSFSFTGLKDLLMELQSLRPDVTYAGAQGEVERDQQGLPLSQNGQPSYPQQEQASSQEATKSDKKKEKKSIAKVVTKIPALTQRMKVYILVGALLLIALIWKGYETVPAESLLYTSYLLTVLIGGATVYLLFFHTKVREEKLAQLEAAPTVEQKQSQPYPAQQVQQEESFSRPAPAPSSFSYGQAQQAPPAPESKGNMYTHADEMEVDDPSMAMDTSLLSDEDDTVLLGDDEDETGSANRPDPSLIVERDGEEERIVISDSHFIIGRNPDSANYVEDTRGVSRVHAEFIRIDDSYGVKDLGSKNGTKVNEDSLVPYKLYSLVEGDVVSIGKVDYTFKWE